MKKIFMEDKLGFCQDWLLHFLDEHAEVMPKDIVDIGAQCGFSRACIYRAVGELQDRVISTDGAPKTYWKLVARLRS